MLYIILFSILTELLDRWVSPQKVNWLKPQGDIGPYKEDATLVEGLLQLVDYGWKADGGTFKPGYTKELERDICKKIPNCTLKATLHIESRVKLLKRQYGAIKEMLSPNASSFGWDDTRKMIVVEQRLYK